MLVFGGFYFSLGWLSWSGAAAHLSGGGRSQFTPQTANKRERDFLSENAASKRHKDLNKRIPDTGLGMGEEKHGCPWAPAIF